MTLIHNTLNTRNALANLIDDLINGGVGAGTLRLRAGTQASPGATILDLPLNTPAFGNATNGVIALNVTGVAGTVSGGGTVGNFQYLDGSGNEVLNGSVGVTGSGADLEFNTNVFSDGANVSMSNTTYTAST